MLVRICLSCICFLLTIKTAFAEIVNVNNEQIKELSKINTPIVDVRRSAEWEQTGVVPNSILLTFFEYAMVRRTLNSRFFVYTF